MILYFLLGAIVLLVIAAIAGTRESSKKGQVAGQRILQMETKYVKFVENYIAGHILKNNNLIIEADKIIDDAIVVILPDIRGILALVNATVYTSVAVNIESEYFPNLVSLTEEFFNRSQKNKSKRLTTSEEMAYIEAAKEAIAADVQQRLINLNIA